MKESLCFPINFNGAGSIQGFMGLWVLFREQVLKSAEAPSPFSVKDDKLILMEKPKEVFHDIRIGQIIGIAETDDTNRGWYSGATYNITKIVVQDQDKKKYTLSTECILGQMHRHDVFPVYKKGDLVKTITARWQYGAQKMKIVKEEAGVITATNPKAGTVKILKGRRGLWRGVDTVIRT